MINISFLSVVLVAVAVGLLGIITYVNNGKRTANRIFALLCGLASGYVAVNYLADYDQARALLWVRGTFVLAVGIIALIYLFVDIFPKPTLGRRWRTVVLSGAVGMATLSCMPSFIAGVMLKPGHTDVVPGPLYETFLVYLAGYFTIITAVVVLSLRRSRGLERQRTWYVAVGLMLTVVLTSITNLILPLLQGHNDYAQLGSYFAIIFLASSSFSIVRHRLFDIRLLVARTLAYLALLAAFSAIYGFGLFVASNYLFPGRQLSLLQLAYYAVTALLLAFTIHPLRQFFERVTDRIFYRDRYDSQEVLSQLGKILISEFKLERLMHKTLVKLCTALDVASGQLYVFSNGKIYRIEDYGSLRHKSIAHPGLPQFRHHVVVADELEGGRDKDILQEYGFRVVVQLHTKGEFVGYLMLGDKLSGDIYTTQDINLLEIFIQELAVAISNAMAYEEIAAFNVTLQGKVDEATRRLRNANQHLKELDEAKDEFISMASHQLRTPLTSIKGYLSMLIGGDAGKLTASQREFSGYAYESAERMVALIADLLNVSRMSAGKFVLDRKPTDLAAVVEDEVRRLQAHAVAKRLSLTYDKPKKKLPMINVDEGKTRQVVMNFIDNALYYTKEGGVVVGLTHADGVLELRVKDTGIGVPKAEQNKLFHKFYRANNAQKVRPDGTGLGLFMAKRVVEDQGGSIIFETTEGKGSTFGFRLPLAPAVTQASS